MASIVVGPALEALVKVRSKIHCGMMVVALDSGNLVLVHDDGGRLANAKHQR